VTAEEKRAIRVTVCRSRRGGLSCSKHLNVDQARFVALLAKAARTQRDAMLCYAMLCYAMLGYVPGKHLNGTTVVRGEHNPTAALGFDPLPAQDTQLSALRNALAALTAAARSELYGLMRIGPRQLAIKKWRRGIREAQSLGDATGHCRVDLGRGSARPRVERPL